MASNDERVNLLISTAVDGLKNVQSLITELEDLESAGRIELPDNTEGLRKGFDETSEAMEGLASRLNELKRQDALVNQFSELKKESRDLARQQELARDSASKLGREYAQLENPTRAQTREFERARKAVNNADQAYIDNQQSLNGLRGELEGAGISTKDLAGEQVRIRKELDGVNTEASELATELTEMRDSATGAAKGTKEAAKGTRDLGDAAERSGGLVNKLGGVLKTGTKLFAGFTAAAGASVATLSIFSKGQADVAREITNTSNALNVNREVLQKYIAAGREFNIEGDKMGDILQDITDKIGDFSVTGAGEGADVFEQLNLSIEEFRNLTPDQQLLKLADAITELDSRSEQVFFLESLASDASRLLPLLDNNAEALRRISAEAEQSGAIYSEADLDKLLEANEIYNDIDLKIQGLTRRLAVELAPAVSTATEKVLDLFNQSDAGDRLIGMFRDLIGWGEDLATDLVENTESIRSGFSTLWSTVKSVSSGMLAVFRGVQAAVSTTVTVLSGYMAAFLSAAQGVTWALNQIGLVSDEAYTKIQAKAQAARDTTVELAKQTAEYGRQAAEAGRGVVAAFDNATESTGKLKEKTEESIGTLKQVPKVGEEITKSLKESGEAGEESAGKILKSFDETFKTLNDEEGLKALEQDLLKAANAGHDVSNELAQVRQRLLEIQALQQNENNISQGLQEVGDSAGGASSEVNSLAEAMGNSSQEAQEFKEKWRDAWGGAFGKAISNARQQVTALSKAARNLFEMKIGGNALVNETESAADALEKARQRTDELATARRRLMSSSLAAWFADTALAAAEVEEKFWGQAVAMENLQEKIQSGSYSMDQLDRISASAANRFDLLDNQRLNGLQQAIDAARQKMKSLADSADSTLDSLRQRLADIRGDTEEAQRLQYEAERERLQEQLKLAQQAGADEAAADYQKSLDTLEQIYQIEQRNRREEENEREQRAADRAREQEMANIERQRAAREREQASSISPARTESVKTVNVNLGGQNFRVLADDEEAFVRALENARSTSL